jgi:NitT/TauT family transport system ATP-binding protein
MRCVRAPNDEQRAGAAGAEGAPACAAPAVHMGADSLAIADVGLTYQTRRGPLLVLDRLTFRTAAGQFVSVLGPSGCGKSTLLRLVSGLLFPSAGSIALSGEPVRGPRPDVGIVFQQPTLLPWKSVFDNVMMPIRALGRDVAAHKPRAEALIALVGLEGFRSAYPHELSGGMQQRVAVARGLINDPTLLLMDEPFAALDAMTRESMMIELQRIWVETHKSVLFITHSIPEAVFLSDRIIVMSARPGHVIRDLDVDLPRPRTIDSMGAARFIELTGELRQMFRAPMDKP